MAPIMPHAVCCWACDEGGDVADAVVADAADAVVVDDISCWNAEYVRPIMVFKCILLPPPPPLLLLRPSPATPLM